MIVAAPMLALSPITLALVARSSPIAMRAPAVGDVGPPSAAIIEGARATHKAWIDASAEISVFSGRSRSSAATFVPSRVRVVRRALRLQLRGRAAAARSKPCQAVGRICKSSRADRLVPWARFGRGARSTSLLRAGAGPLPATARPRNRGGEKPTRLPSGHGSARGY